MSKFVFVKEKPENLEKGEYFIPSPNFYSEIAENANKASKNGLTGPNHLRAVTATVARIYDPENMTAFSTKVHKFEGRRYANSDELNAIVYEMFEQDYPNVFHKWVEFKIKNRPPETKLIYFQDTGIHRMDSVFFQFGLSYDHDKEEELKQ